MPNITPLTVRLLPEVRELVASFMSRMPEAQMTLCFIKGRLGGKAKEGWTFGAYGPKELRELELLGKPFLYAVDDLVVAIPQGVEELAGNTIGWVNGRLVITKSGLGI